MKNFRLEITTPSGVCFADNAVQLSAVAVDGSLSIMAGHIPLVTALKGGECRVYLENGDVKHADCDGGMLVVTADKVRLLSSSFTFK